MSVLICPTCKGEKQYYRQCLPTYLSGWQPCKTCKAIGSITEEKQSILELADIIRDKRRELHLSPSAISGLVPLSENFWRTVEAGDANLGVTRYALGVIERIAGSFVEKFDVFLYSSATKREKVKTCDSRAEADEVMKTTKSRLKVLGLGGYCEIVSRKERILEVK